MVSLIFALVLLFMPSTSRAATYYVATTGSNSNDGLTESTPKLTIAHTVSLMVAGDTAYVHGGTYNEGYIRFSRPGTQASPIKLLNYPNEIPIIVFVNPNAPTNSNNNRIDILHASGQNVAIGWITIEGFEITNGHDGIKWYSGHDLTIQRNKIHGNHFMGLIGIGGLRVSILKNIIHSNGNDALCALESWRCNQHHGIYAHGSDYIIRENVFYNQRTGFGIQQNGSSTSNFSASVHPSAEFAGAANWIIDSNTFAYQYRRGGIVMWGANCDGTRIENNIFYENNVTNLNSGPQGIEFTSASNSTGTSFRNNHCYASGSGNTTCLGSGSPADIITSGNVINISPPAFVDGGSNSLPVSPDFRLTASAPVNICLPNEFPNNSTCVVGAFKTIPSPTAVLTANIATLTFPMSTAVPVSNLSTTGVSLNCPVQVCPGSPAVDTVAKRTGTDTQVDVTISGITSNACLSDATSATISYDADDGSWTGNDNIGPYPGLSQKIFSFTNLAVTNLCDGTAPSGYPAGYYMYYKFDEGTGTNANDESANNLDGTLTNGATWGNGKHGAGVTIADNTTQYVAIPYGSGVNPTTQSLTIAFGVNVPQGAQSLSNGYFGTPIDIDRRFYISMANGTWRVGAQASNDAQASELAVDVGWNHLCLTVEAGTPATITLHKNGVASTSSGARKTVTSYTLAGNIELGHIAGFTGGDGTFDDFLIYQSVQDCAAIYTAFQSGSSSPSGTFAQEAVQAQAVHLVGGSPANIASLNAPKTVVARGAVAVVFQVHCENVEDCSATAFRLTYRRNGSASRMHVPNAETSDGIWMYGQSTETGLNTGTTTTRLTGTCSVTAGSTQVTADQVPNVDLPQDGCVMLRYLVRVRNPGDYFDLALQTENGVDLNGGYDVESRITVIGAQANAGP